MSIIGIDNAKSKQSVNGNIKLEYNGPYVNINPAIKDSSKTCGKKPHLVAHFARLFFRATIPTADMFIYEFMSGIAGYIAGGESEDYYDPHMHRKVMKPTTYAETLIHMIKGSLGAGVLAMPQAMYKSGLIIGIPGLIIIGIFATFCIHQLINAEYEVCRRLRVGYLPFGHCAEQAVLWGPKCMKWISRYMPFIIDASLVFFQLGLCMVYPVFVAENGRQILDAYGFYYSVRTLMLILLPALILVSLIKDLKMLAPVSTVSNIVIIFGLTLVFFYLIEKDVVLTSEHWATKPAEGLPVFVGITLFALEAVGVVLALEYNMERPKQFGGYFGLFNIGMTAIIALYMAVGVCGYVKYGDQIKASITLNLPDNDKKAQASKGLLAVAIFLSFPLQNFVAYQILWDKWKKRFAHHKNLRLEDYAMRIMCTVLPWAVAFLLPNLQGLISLIGSVAISLLAFMVPPFMDICLVWSQAEWPRPRMFSQKAAMDVVVQPALPPDAAAAAAAATAAAKASTAAAKSASAAEAAKLAALKAQSPSTTDRLLGMFNASAEGKPPSKSPSVSSALRAPVANLAAPAAVTSAAPPPPPRRPLRAEPVPTEHRQLSASSVIRIFFDILLIIAGILALTSGLITSLKDLLA